MKNILLLLKQCHENFRSESPRCRNSSEMENDALIHHERLNGVLNYVYKKKIIQNK